nr:uncharacterized protein LOC111420043 [Onthophagus taurus]
MEGERGVWDAVKLLKDRALQEKGFALHHVKDCSLDDLKKMVEIVFKDTDVEIDIYTTTAKRKEDQKSKQDRTIIGQRKTYALIVENRDKSYTEVVRGIKEQMKGKAEAEKIEGIRQTRDGKVLVVTKRDKDATEKIEEILNREKGQNVSSRGIEERKKRAYICIKGMEITTQREEVIEAVKQWLGSMKEEECKIGKLRPYAISMQAVTIETNRDTISKLIKNGRIRVGLANCQIEERRDIKKCLLCWSATHLARDCPNEDRRGWCFKCGDEGRQTSTCENEERCPDCKVKGHRAGTGRCPIYRKLLNQVRDKDKNAEREQQKKEKNTHTETRIELRKDTDTEITSNEKRRQNVEVSHDEGLEEVNEKDEPLWTSQRKGKRGKGIEKRKKVDKLSRSEDSKKEVGGGIAEETPHN